MRLHLHGHQRCLSEIQLLFHLGELPLVVGGDTALNQMQRDGPAYAPKAEARKQDAQTNGQHRRQYGAGDLSDGNGAFPCQTDLAVVTAEDAQCQQHSGAQGRCHGDDTKKPARRWFWQRQSADIAR